MNPQTYCTMSRIDRLRPRELSIQRTSNIFLTLQSELWPVLARTKQIFLVMIRFINHWFSLGFAIVCMGIHGFFIFYSFCLIACDYCIVPSLAARWESELVSENCWTSNLSMYCDCVKLGQKFEERGIVTAQLPECVAKGCFRTCCPHATTKPPRDKAFFERTCFKVCKVTLKVLKFIKVLFWCAFFMLRLDKVGQFA